MLDLRQTRVAAPLLHISVFVLTWLLYWIQSQPLMDGPSRFPFAVILVADLPFSLYFFGIIFTSAERFPYAVALWGVLGTLWWWFLGSLIDKRLHRTS
jgi:hypothetical protein